MPLSHHSKKGTPTMGGVMILGTIIISYILASIILQQEIEDINNNIIPIGILTIYYFAVGFIDDISKIRNKNSGIKALTKIFHQFVGAALSILFLKIEPSFFLPIFGKILVNQYIYYILSTIIIVSASNAFNITDGLDELATLSALPVILAIYIMSGNWISSAIGAGLIGFWFYNRKPAKIFMGDCGALPIGGLMGLICIIEKIEFFVILASFIFVIELASSLIQIGSYHLLKRRVFKMSPLHHHLECNNWTEEKIVMTFAILSLCFSTIAVFLWIKS
ncbi:Phospho-N-acetylmuramoyl-pentapeptide-transferase [Candidatus Gromoviella agglomerans]|nr:Phospho-N-acetylmuramoyl-pentapeptide-transferase [Candidatus Gromoviella agglomerans]